MKGRSHRLAVDQKDDWVEESWTVDCSCGVNFDDGEEMVDCDDCGVWVHTRCSRYVKTDNSFVCDKCKNNDSSEETEVAQLLVELPTKTVPLPSPPCTSSAVTAFVRPFKRSIKDRVHVQGIPGDAGDPELFSGISAVFGPQLWKCSGYIPKKFNFKYKEFPYEEMIDRKDCGMKIETRTDDGAGALLSLAQLDVEKQPEEGHRFAAPRESSFNSDRLTPKNEVGKDTGSMKPPLLHYEKSTREDALNTKDRSGKKKVRLFEKDGDCSKRIRLHSPDRGHMAAEIDPHCGRSENSSYTLPTSHLSHDPVVVDHAVDAQKSNSKESNSKDNSRQPLPLKLGGFSKTTTGASSVSHSMSPVEEEVASFTAVTPEVLGGKLLGSGGTGMQQAEQIHENSAATGSKVDEGGSFRELHAKSNSELASGSKIVKALSLYGTKLSSSGTSLVSQEIPSSEIASVSDNTITGSVTCDLKVEDDARRSEVVDLHKRRVDGESPSTAVDSDKSNVMASAAGSVTTPSQILMLMSSASEFHGDSVDSKRNLVRESSLNGASTEVVEDEVRHEKAGKLIKEHSKSPLTYVPKSSQLKKISHAASVSRKTPCDLRDSALESSSSPTRVTPPASHPTSEPSNGQQKMIGTSLHESASNLQKMVTVLQSSSKVSNALTHSAAPSNSPAALSDEELALLLHQELNSSPRVPRVPRMRNAGSLPQLPSPTATSVLMKRTSSTGGKDHVLAFSRRKNKDSTGQSSGEMDDEAKKMDRISSPKDLRKQEEADSGSASGMHSIKKSRRFASGSLTATAEGNEYNYSSSRQSTKIPSDEEKGGGPPITHRTLPGLLAEIMREGKRMTYEELCNSVLPHWPYLRKHNGERYAYSSHSQAVLDCLRNRHEWARLVDRGPKTSAGRKKRKADADENDGRREHEEFPKGKRKARKRKRLQPKSDEMSDASYSDMSLSNDASDGTYN